MREAQAAPALPAPTPQETGELSIPVPQAEVLQLAAPNQVAAEQVVEEGPPEFVEPPPMEGPAPLSEGDKVKFVHMKTPNPIGNHVFSFPSVFPPELDLHKYVDRKDMFEKSFLAPLEAIVSCIGWSAEKKANLESFFV